MKSFFRWGVLATALMALTGGAVTAQAPAPSLPATKVGVVNIGLLFTKYEKALLYKKELENELLPLKAEAERINANMKGHQEWLEKGGAKTDPAQAEKSQQAIRDGKRALEDLDMRARKAIGKKQETQLIQLYKDIHGAVQVYAQQTGFHMIFAYGDPPDGDPFSFQNINRKMGGMDMGAAVPYYTQTGLDISHEVLMRLNAAHRQAGGAAPINQTGFTPKQ